MSARTDYLEVEPIGLFPTVALLLVLFLTAIGLVAHVALV